VWYVQAADPSGQGTWSKGKLFIVEAGVLTSLPEERVKKTLREKGIREDVITDVLREMKVEGQGVISGKTDSKPQGKVGAQGSEGETNTLYGLGAGFSISGGLSNTFIGRNAGYYTTTGNSNTILGHYAGYFNTTGYANIFLGYSSGYYNTTGYDNTFLGNLPDTPTRTETTTLSLDIMPDALTPPEAPTPSSDYRPDLPTLRGTTTRSSEILPDVTIRLGPIIFLLALELDITRPAPISSILTIPTPARL
jgi:hypothetical protein